MFRLVRVANRNIFRLGVTMDTPLLFVPLTLHYGRASSLITSVNKHAAALDCPHLPACGGGRVVSSRLPVRSAQRSAVPGGEPGSWPVVAAHEPQAVPV